MNKLCGLIPAAGKGTRAYPYTKRKPKSMLDINGNPNLLRNIILMRDSLKITDIFVVVGYYGDAIKEYFGDGSKYNVNITYIENDCLDKGLAYSVFLGKQYIDDHFVVILSDECYVGSNHHELLAHSYKDALATITIKEIDDKELIRKNYSVEIENGRVVRLIEKPKEVRNYILGCGTFVFSPEIFSYLDKAFNSSNDGNVDLITLIDELCGKGERINYFELSGNYVNINDRDSLHLANYYEREHTFDKNIISLLISSEGYEEDIDFTIGRYKKSSDIDNIYVVLPHENGVEDKVRSCGAEVIKCPPEITQYGEKLKYGMSNCPGDIFILTLANYSFSYRDISKLLAYLREADMVVGTRTTRQLIQQRSNMRGIVRVANVMLAKVLELAWLSFDCSFSDVGCVFSAVWKNTFFKVKDNLKSRGPQFSVEMTMEILRARDKIIEIPVNYYGRSYSVYRIHQNPATFFKMLYTICSRSLSHHLKELVSYWR